jgi:hypothetical protein
MDWRGLSTVIAEVADTFARFDEACQQMSAACERMADSAVADLTVEQRDICRALVACGTPVLDAVVEASDLAHR